MAVVLGSLIRPVVPAAAAIGLVAVATVLVAGQELGFYRLTLPQNARQVPQSIREAGGRVGGLSFGFEMGTGVRTFMTSGLPHVLLVSVLLYAAWPHALVAGLFFGVGRAWMTLSRLWYLDHDGWDDQLAERDRLIRIVLMVGAAALAASIVWVAL